MPDVGQLNEMRAYFDTGVTKPYEFRIKQLRLLRDTLDKYEADIYAALYADLKKGKEECWITENGFTRAEISNALGYLKKWMKPQKVGTNLMNLPSSSYVYAEPLGVVLIIGPWNYPLQLLLAPLIGAIAAGNCVVLKASELAPATAVLMEKMIAETFDPKYVSYTREDGSSIVPAMMNNFSFDHVFYTGSTAIGKQVYEMAASKLVPVTLELGGKSPCVVTAHANVKVTARRIALTKFSNAGQMCVAPDYIIVHQSIKAQLVAELVTAIKDFYGEDAAHSDVYGKMINTKQFDRLVGYVQAGEVLHGGKYDRDTLFIEPTLLDTPGPGDKVMQDEIFGPLLPVLPYETFEEAAAIIAQHKNPLAFYVFTNDAAEERKWIEAIPFGGGCVNNAALHLTNHRLPFGGRGFSGTGRYHGKYSFETFSHQKAVMKTPTWFDPKIKYPPMTGKLNMLKKLIR